MTSAELGAEKALQTQEPGKGSEDAATSTNNEKQQQSQAASVSAGVFSDGSLFTDEPFRQLYTAATPAPEDDPEENPEDPDFNVATCRWSTYDPEAGKQIDAGSVPESYQTLLEEDSAQEDPNRGSVFGFNLNPFMHKPIWENKRTGKDLRKKANKGWETGSSVVTMNNTGLVDSDPWVVPKKINCSVFMSGTDIDFRRGHFVHPVCQVHASQCFGGLTVHVPRGVKVINKGMGIFGMHGNGVSRTEHLGGGDGPTIELFGFSVFGSANTRVDENVPAVKLIRQSSTASADLEPPTGYLTVEPPTGYLTVEATALPDQESTA